MSVLIKGMDMPKSCSKCKLRYIAIGLEFQCAISGETVDDFYETRHPNCALVAISTPHGRLIDADEVEERLQKYWYEEYPNQEADYHRAFMDSNACIKDLPTIIEAEVSNKWEK